ncbi:hypothetical protein [Pseudomonas sp. 460]|uniref:hypothetical protein n=1 Tax=Pseudomonas sp. 460 TaxID=2485142 RepID=UPI00104AD6B2|nr:hypothetical protein [Pseudomonas sp. 460]TCV51362.1 hypothetical protein EDB99_10728 [Pseudomonas sp. 460]
MKFQKILCGVSNGQLPEETLVKILQDLSRETIASSEGGMSSGALIVKRWELNSGSFVIEFSEQALALMEVTQDKRAELVNALFQHITASVH